ncbi:MAG TPA: hypothetical protein P5323_03855 [Candidatus Moranbacteria bacterium]|nr:hypothetical protein [Candidatus Moranbacteria bacterium]HRY28246.1 hypothetical protein [Candidatus Moranbacteria bacterium]HSA08335.1 hypothetical protein [Candidatus Moranbacteria bacterium]
MRTETKAAIIVSIIAVIFIALVMLGAYRDITAEKRPFATLVGLNVTPEKVYNSNSLNPMDSVIYLMNSPKWKTEFKYAYRIKNDKWFSWTEYLNFHRYDGVDGGCNKLIFSNEKLDPKEFVISSR